MHRRPAYLDSPARRSWVFGTAQPIGRRTRIIGDLLVRTLAVAALVQLASGPTPASILAMGAITLAYVIAPFLAWV